nr:hypothetical protein GCM10020092_066030 [Actinoplanes digitatis]
MSPAPAEPVLRTTTPTLSGTLGTADRYYNAGFAVEPLSAPGGSLSGSGYGQGPKVSWQVPSGKLANRSSYRWWVDFSGVGENWENTPRSAPCEFTVDAPVPNPPAVSSPDYPEGDQRHGTAGQPGAFTFGQAVDESQAALRVSFNKGSGSTADNESGSVVTTTLNGGAGWAGGPTGSALSLNGTGAYASTDSRVISPGEDFTVGAWVKPTGLGAAATALSQHSTVQSIFRLGYSKTDNRWALIQPATNTTNAPVAKALSTSVPQAGVWTHLVGVHDSARKQLRLYVNGRLEGTAFYTTPLRDIEMPFQIGRGLINGAGAEYWPGQIDDVVAWTRRLGDAEIGELARPVSYTYQLDGQAAAEAPGATGAAKVTVTPDRNGTRTLTVRARSATGELSALSHLPVPGRHHRGAGHAGRPRHRPRHELRHRRGPALPDHGDAAAASARRRPRLGPDHHDVRVVGGRRGQGRRGIGDRLGVVHGVGHRARPGSSPTARRTPGAPAAPTRPVPAPGRRGASSPWTPAGRSRRWCPRRTSRPTVRRTATRASRAGSR